MPDWPLLPNKSHHRWSVYTALRGTTRRSKQVRDYITKVVDMEEPIPDWLQAGETTDYESEDGPYN